MLMCQRLFTHSCIVGCKTFRSKDRCRCTWRKDQKKKETRKRISYTITRKRKLHTGQRTGIRISIIDRLDNTPTAPRIVLAICYLLLYNSTVKYVLYSKTSAVRAEAPKRQECLRDADRAT